MAKQTTAAQTTAETQTIADRKAAAIARLGLRHVPQYLADGRTIAAQTARTADAQRAEAQAEAEARAQDKPQTTTTATQTTGKSATRAARKAKAEAEARAQDKPQTVPGIAGAQTVPAGKLRYASKGAKTGAPTQPAKGAQTAGRASAKPETAGKTAKGTEGAQTAAQTQDKPAKAPKAPKTVYTDSMAAISPITSAQVYAALGGKAMRAEMYVAARAGKCGRTGGNTDLLLWVCGRPGAVLEAGGKLPAHVRLACRALAQAVQDGLIAGPTLAYLADCQYTGVVDTIAEIAGRHLFTPELAAAYCNGWHLLPAGTRAQTGDLWYRRVYHLPAADYAVDCAMAAWRQDIDRPVAAWAPRQPDTAVLGVLPVQTTPEGAPEGAQTA